MNSQEGKPTVKKGTHWKHRNGCEYLIILLTNENSNPENSDKYPVNVVYIGMNGNIWSRPLTDWHRSMTPIDNE